MIQVNLIARTSFFCLLAAIGGEHPMDRKRNLDFGEELAKLDESDKDERERRETKEENEFALIQRDLAPPLLVE